MPSKVKKVSSKKVSPEGHIRNPNYKGKNFKTPEKKVSSKKVSPEGHIRNPNYKGKNYKTPEKKVNKYFEIITNPLKSLNEERKKIASFLKIEKVIQTVSAPITVQSNKFDAFLKTINNPANRALAIAIPIILVRLSTLIIQNRSLFKDMFSSFSNTTTSANWANSSFYSKIYIILGDYMLSLWKSSGVLGVADLILLAGLLLDDIPKIIKNKDYINVPDINAFKLSQELAKNTKDVAIMYQAPEKEKKDRQVIKTLNENMGKLINKLEVMPGDSK
jgi:hypothetical protein